MPQDTEQWKHVVDFEGFYEVSSFGRVRRIGGEVRRTDGKVIVVEERILHGSLYKGYRRVTLRQPGKMVSVNIHKLVGAAFLGERPASFEICHSDGDKKNNRLDNLRYDSRRGNAHDMAVHGTVLFGEAHPRAKITETEAREIKRRRKNGETLHSLAAEYRTTISAVWKIASGKTWRHI